jgi:hypothetical protein
LVVTTKEWYKEDVEIHVVCWKRELFFNLKLTNLDEFQDVV